MGYVQNITRLLMISLHTWVTKNITCTSTTETPFLSLGGTQLYFFQCFQSSAFPRISAVSSFPLSNQREREMRKKNAYKITLIHNRASERNAEKLLTKNIPNRAPALRTSELWASCAVHTFILLTSGVLNGNNLAWGIHILHRCYFLLDLAR